MQLTDSFGIFLQIFWCLGRVVHQDSCICVFLCLPCHDKKQGRQSVEQSVSKPEVKKSWQQQLPGGSVFIPNIDINAIPNTQYR